MSGPADRLLRLIYEWMKEAEECSSNLRGLAKELESLREDCNAWETVGNTVAVAGSLLSICAAPFTGGGSLFLAGAVAGGLGAGVSVVTKITEQFKSSSKLERVKEIDKRCNEITDKIQDLFEELRKQCPSSSTDERDKHAVNEFLKAMSRRSGLEISSIDLDDLIRCIMDSALGKTFTTGLASLLVFEVVGVLSVFSLELGGTLLSAVVSTGGKQIGKAVVLQGASKLEGTLLSAAVSTGAKQIGKSAAIKGASRFLGGVVGLAFSLPEAIDSWTEAIKNKHETEASKSLRDMAKKIDTATENLSGKLKEIQKLLKEELNKHRSKPRPPPDPPILQTSSSILLSGVLPQFRYMSMNATEIPQPATPQRPSTSLQLPVRPYYPNISLPSIHPTRLYKVFNNLHLHTSDPPQTTKTFKVRDRFSIQLPNYPQRSVKLDDEQHKVLEISGPPRDYNLVGKGLKMALLNARSANKFITREDTALIELIQDNDLDVLMVTETWFKTENLTDNQASWIRPPNYTLFNVPRFFDHETTRGGGVAIVAREDLQPEQVYFGSTMTFEYVAVAVTPPGSSERVLNLNIYRPPSGTLAEFSRDFLDELSLLMCDVYARFENVVIGGDFNIWVDDKEDKKTEWFEEFAHSINLVQHVSQPTHNRGHILDLVFATPSVRISDVSVQNNWFSDHHTVFFRAKVKEKDKQEKTLRKK